ncbi:MAG: zinc finger AN1 domain-containing stress-associated protein [Candidatus Jordarchaeaceae archaeon]
MSNLIFQALINGLTQTIFQNFASELTFKMRARNIAQGSVEHKGHRVDVFLIMEGEKLSIILPDNSILKDDCEQIAKKILLALYASLGKKIRLEEIVVTRFGYASGICNYCLIVIPLAYKCRRCGGFYCEEHRLPEKHNCPRGKEGEITSKNITGVEKPHKGKMGEIILSEVPCG